VDKVKRTVIRKIVAMHRFLILLALLIGVGFAGASSVSADPIQFSNVVAIQNGGATKVDLLSHPGVNLIGPQLSFLVDISGTLSPGNNTLLKVTYIEAGSSPIVQSFQIPAFGTIPPPFTQLFTVTSAGASFQGVPALLTVEILEGSISTTSRTYAINVVQPIPEPNALLLFGTGLGAVVTGVRRKLRSRQ